MHLTHIELQGFRTYNKLETLDLTTKPGLVHLAGANHDDPTLGGNAAGKSSLWEGVCWVAYGKTSEGLRGPELATWGKGQGIYGMLHVNGAKILRTWGPIKLHLNGEDATQEEIDKVLGATFDQFLSRTFISQHADKFLDLTATEKTDLLAGVLGLDQWSERSVRADIASRAAGVELSGRRERAAALNASIGVLESQDYAALAARWDRRVSTEARADRAAIYREEGIAAGLEVEGNRLRRVVDVAREKTVAAERQHSDASARKRSLDAEYDALKQAREGKTCPTCGTALKAGTASPLAPLAALVNGAHRDHALCHSELRLCEREEDDARRPLDSTLLELARVNTDRVALKRVMAAAAKAINPFTDLAKTQEVEVAKQKSELATCLAATHALEARKAHHEFWVKGFKDVRLFLVAEALQQLEVETNSSLVELGLHGWSIKYRPDSETKSGGVRRGFAVLIEAPTNPHPVPWEAWSGGERQRLRVAAQMGLSNLISDYTGVDALVEVWDEPSNGMSEQGISDLLLALSRRAVAHNRQVWVVDHRSLASGLFDSTVLAVKSGGTTTLEKT